MKNIARDRLALALFLGWLAGCVLGGCGDAGGRRRVGPAGATVANGTAASDLTITWVRSQAPAETVWIGEHGVAIRLASGIIVRRPFVRPSQGQDLHLFRATYGSWHVRAAGGELIFSGAGATPAGETERRMIGEWTRVALLEADEGARGDLGLVFAWHRGESSGGVCDDLAVYLTGDLEATSCGSAASAHGRLDAERLRRLYGWFDALAAFQWGEQEGEGLRADAMLERLHFAGRGSRAPTHDEIAAISTFAGSLHRELTAPPRPPPRPLAPGAAAVGPSTPAARAGSAEDAGLLATSRSPRGSHGR